MRLLLRDCERDCLQHLSMAPTRVYLPHMGTTFEKEHTPDRKDIVASAKESWTTSRELYRVLQRCCKNLAGDPSNTDESTHVSACSTASSIDLWKYICLNISSPTPVCPNIATQWRFAKSTPQQTTKSKKSLLLKDLSFIFIFFLLLLQLVLCHVAALKSPPTSSIVQIIFSLGPLRSANVF